MQRRHYDDVLAQAEKSARTAPIVAAEDGLFVEHRGSGFVGVVQAVERRSVTLLDDSGLLRVFPLDVAGFRLVDSGVVVTLAPPAAPARTAPARTPSGAIAGVRGPARVARAHRMLVEGIHDAELLEKVWGDELRPEGIVVEPLDGADHLAAEVQRRAPGPQRRLGVLLDHLVAGSKESRLAAAVAGPHVLVDGHEFVDVWQAVRPHVIGLREWPQVPPGRSWKAGICEALGGNDPASLWRQILAAVRDYRDLEPSLVGAVERLLDFLLAPASTP